ncbi:putative GPI anchored protein [Mollisia scopiformis]|uniref:Putative GPI anchored protein n=1 Tax=Mollisia scopiformis TaxID=149040 RepID=A0A194X6Q6_MOLSC|nr:putative GPI anchored protein [Mollisia scopiformis]KUJ15856.1 putative GPI anchored protein [Mollisia scopiformis]
MFNFLTPLLLILFTLATFNVAYYAPNQPRPRSVPPKCRFSPTYTQQDILNDPASFISDILYWEGQYHQNNVSYNAHNGMSYDGTLLNETTGFPTAKHPFSAASKELLQIMLYTHALAGSHSAAQFLSPDEPRKARSIAFEIMSLKLQTYLKFNETYPGFGGFLPWYTGDSIEITPTYDWVNRVPALDNGGLIWAVYSAVQVLEMSAMPEYNDLVKKWQSWLDYTKTTAAKVVSHIFYKGDGIVCAVTDPTNQTYQVNDPQQNYTCEGNNTLNDPYEGEFFTWWLYFFGGLSDKDKNLLWEVKRPQLVSVDYDMDGFGPVTVQKGNLGFLFSSHEQWKVMEMPYYDVEIVKRVYHNAERARTCNSVVTKVPGMFASVNNSTNPTTGQIIGYISNAGIPSISNQTVQELDVMTPYSVFPLILFNKAIGMAWWKNMVDGKKMQNPYGSSESTRVDGTATSSFVSWDSKLTTVNAILGGVGHIVREKMQRDGLYDDFVYVLQREYGSVFKQLRGEDYALCLPSESIPDEVTALKFP